MTGRLLDYGDRAVLVEFDDVHAVTPAWQRLTGRAGSSVRAVVPAARTVLVEFVPGALSPTEQRDWVTRQLAAMTIEQNASSAGEPVEIAVRYDGADLDQVADLIGESREAVVARHCAPLYEVLFCGFSPGFAYLVGGDPVLRPPRLDSPRTSVPAGSVAIAAEFTGIYPRSSPGGWRLLGRTEAVLFDPGRPQPALLPPGTSVRLRPS